MEPVTRAPEPVASRPEAAAPRGAELQAASQRFAELLGKDRRDSRAVPLDERRPQRDADFAEGDADGVAERSELASGPDPSWAAAFLAAQGRGDGHPPRREAAPPDELPVADAPSRVPAAERHDAPAVPDAPAASFDPGPLELPRFLGPPRREAEPPPEVEAARFLGPAEGLGDTLLRAFAPAAPASATEPHAAAGRTERIDAIQRLGEQLAERILVSAPEAGAAPEMLIQLRDAALPGTEVRVAHDGHRLVVTLTTDHAASFDLLAARQAELQSRLGDAAVVQLSFDPEGMISRQRLEAPQQAEGSAASSDDRGRERGDGRPRRGRERRDDEGDDRR